MNNNLKDLIFLRIINYKVIQQHLDEFKELNIDFKVFCRIFMFSHWSNMNMNMNMFGNIDIHTFTYSFISIKLVNFLKKFKVSILDSEWSETYHCFIILSMNTFLCRKSARMILTCVKYVLWHVFRLSR